MLSVTANVSAISYLGGDQVVLQSAAWPVGLLTASIVDPSQTVSLACITGRVGSMYATYALGQSLTFYAPQLHITSTAVTLNVVQGDGSTLASVSLAVVPPMYGSCTFDVRDLLPANWARGATNVADVPVVGY